VIAAMETDAGLKEISIISEVSPNVVVFADRYAILTVIRNLLSNAVKFTPSGGSVSINAIHDNNETLISITDTGVGFSADEAEDVFRIGKGSTPGTSGEKGTGFGLILCKDLVERNNGTIKLTSKLGKGSRFDIRLPMEDTLVLQSVNEADANTPGRIEISWDHYKKLGFSVIEGNFAAAEFREALEKLWRNVDFYPEYGMLADVRRTIFRFENNSASELMNMFANMPGQNISRRFAILTSTPQQVAYATMFSMQIRKKYPFVVEVFSTHEAAILWLSGS
jgi:anti-sigma regulatory factor (Ser/Thr protein kinase)